MRIFGLEWAPIGLDGLGTGSNGLQREDALSPQVENFLQSHDDCGSLLLVGIRTLKRGRVYLEKFYFFQGTRGYFDGE